MIGGVVDQPGFPIYLNWFLPKNKSEASLGLACLMHGKSEPKIFSQMVVQNGG